MSGRRSWDDWDVYDHPPPIPVEGGIRARSRRGNIGETWWSQRFVAALESYYGTTASRLSRGRAYARAGQVVRMDLEPGIVTGVVQGSRTTPYDVSIRVRLLSEADWGRVETAMATRAVFLARLLAGEMPNEIEEAFDAVETSLFPVKRGDLRTACSCPDTANPCKHVAAVYYLLAESFDRDPFLIFAWRGRPRDRLIAELRALRPVAPSAGATARPGTSSAVPPAASFWRGRPGWREVHVDPHPPGAPDALLRQMDDEVAAALGQPALAVLRAVYAAASKSALRRLDPSAASSPDRDSARRATGSTASRRRGRSADR